YFRKKRFMVTPFLVDGAIFISLATNVTGGKGDCVRILSPSSKMVNLYLGSPSSNWSSAQSAGITLPQVIPYSWFLMVVNGLEEPSPVYPQLKSPLPLSTNTTSKIDSSLNSCPEVISSPASFFTSPS